MTAEERRLMERAIRGWLHKGAVISDEVAILLARGVCEYSYTERDYGRSLGIIHDFSTFSDWDGLTKDIEREMGVLSSDFPEDVPQICKLCPLKEWTERKKAECH